MKLLVDAETMCFGAPFVPTMKLLVDAETMCFGAPLIPTFPIGLETVSVNEK
ncbi:MAG: hypothetical protein PHT41_02455 [Candidatus Omnitrophica bacterium]|nr:hypothetical protein [Candidatus Omnitrophota bacterium]